MIKELRPGDPVTVGPYRILGRLGTGGMGQVYLARSPGGRLVAIKVIRPELAEEQGFRARFAREVAAAKTVSGVFTAAVVDADPAGEMPWLATAYVPGPSLTDAVQEQGPLPVETVLGLAAGLAEGLQAIHAAGLVHRDLKPSNVLLAQDGPRVIDFGISRAHEGSMLTQTGTVMGSPGFMSPEQARGRRTIGPASDVFSLGAVLAFAATGDSPFGGGPTPALMYRVVHEPPDLSEVPGELRPLLEWCLSKDPDDRPTTGQILDQLSTGAGALDEEWLPGPVTATFVRYVATTPGAIPVAEPALPGPQPAAPEREERAEPAQTAHEPAEPAAAPAAATGVISDLGVRSAATVLATPAAAGPTAVRPQDVLTQDPAQSAGGSSAGGPSAGGSSAGGPGGPVIPLKRPPRRRWPLAVAAAAAVMIVAAVAAVFALSPAGARKGTAGPSPSPSTTSAQSPKPTPDPNRTPPTTKPASSATQVSKKHTGSSATPASSQPVPQTTPAVTSSSGQPSATNSPPTTPASTPATAPATGPPAISSASGVTSIGCSQYGSAGSSPGGTPVAFTFVNQSSADIQVWYLASGGNGDLEGTVAPDHSFTPAVDTEQDWMVATSGDGCIGIFTIDSGGQVVAS